MKVYASNFDIMAKPWATEVDKYVGKDIWVRATCRRFKQTFDAYIRVLDKVLDEGNIYYMVNMLNTTDEFEHIPGIKCEMAYTRRFPYLSITLTHPIELATSEDLISSFYLDGVAEHTEATLDQYVGSGVWVKVAVGFVINGNPCLALCYARFLSKSGNTYTYNRMYAADIDDQYNQYTDYTRDDIEDILNMEYRNSVDEFGVSDNPKELTTDEIVSALDKPWLGAKEV